MSIVILIIICIGLIIHRHLSSNWEAGSLPNPHVFTFFAMVFIILYFINFIWLFGFIVGLVLTLLTIFQITYATFLWPFLIPRVILNNRESDFVLMLTKDDEPSKLLYYGWIFLILGLVMLTIANFFVGNYSFLTDAIIETVNNNYQEAIGYVALAIIGGNLLRVITMRLLTR